MSNERKPWPKIGDIRVSVREGVKKTRVVMIPNSRIQIKNQKTGEWQTVELDKYGGTFLKSSERIIEDIDGLADRGYITAEEADNRKQKVEEKGIKYEILVPPSSDK